MHLKIFHGDEIIIYQDIDKTFFRVRTEDGLMNLQFDISPYHPQYKYFDLYVQIEFDNQLYLITGINERKSISTITCDLDLTGLSSNGFSYFHWTNQTFASVTDTILEGTGWSILGASTVTKKSTTKIDEFRTSFEILDYFRNVTSYNACYKFNAKTKTITVIHPYNNTAASGVYFTDDLNLVDLAYKGSALNIVTKLYPVGKDGLRITNINNGKSYIENHIFTDRTIIAEWRDERYTDPQALLDDARLKLAESAKPEQSYTVKVIDLAKLLPDKYGDVLSYDLYDIVTIIDRRRNKRLDHRIVEIKEYPADPTLNTIVLSTKPLKIKTVRKR